MRPRSALLLLPLLLATAVACAPEAGAIDVQQPTEALTEAPPEQRPSAEQPTRSPALIPLPSSTIPAIQAPATVVPSPAATVPRTQAPVDATVAAPAPLPTRPPVAAATPTPRPAPTATRVPVDPHATPTPLWEFIPSPTPSPTPTQTPLPVPTTYVPPDVISAAPGEEFQSALRYRYALPSSWSAVNTGDSVVLHDPTRFITVTITESVIERWRHPTVYVHGFDVMPPQPDGWEIWNRISTEGLWPDEIFESEFTGMKNGVPYVNVRRSFLWGELQIEASLEIPETIWVDEDSPYESAIGVLHSFRPHDDSTLFTADDVLGLLAVRMDDRFSGIYGRDEVIKARVELSCQQIFTDFVQTPVFNGHGVWQVYAPTTSGTESWQIFEPTGTINAISANQSSC